MTTLASLVNLCTADEFGDDLRADPGRISQQDAQRRFLLDHGHLLVKKDSRFIETGTAALPSGS